MDEIWKNISGYNGIYQVSNYGRIKSLDRVVNGKLGSKVKRKGIILKPILDKSGYLRVSLYPNGKIKPMEIHRLVWQSFGGEKSNRERQIDHIDNDKTNNNIENLRIVSNRENSTKRSLQYPKTSKYTGVYLDKKTGRWVAQIRKPKSTPKESTLWLGRYQSEIQASLAYQKALISFGGL
jgi:hypothetical protein